MDTASLSGAELLRRRALLDFEITRRRRTGTWTRQQLPRLPADVWVRVLDYESHGDLRYLESGRLVAAEWRQFVERAALAPAALDNAKSIRYLRRRWALGAVAPAHVPGLVRIAETPPGDLQDVGPRKVDGERVDDSYAVVLEKTSRLFAFNNRRKNAMEVLATLAAREPGGAGFLVRVLTRALDECAVCGAPAARHPQRHELLLFCPSCALSEEAGAFRDGDWFTRRKRLEQRTILLRGDAADVLSKYTCLRKSKASSNVTLPVLVRMLGDKWLLEGPDAYKHDVRRLLARAIISIRPFAAPGDARALASTLVEAINFQKNSNELDDGWLHAAEDVLIALTGVRASEIGEAPFPHPFPSARWDRLCGLVRALPPAE